MFFEPYLPFQFPVISWFDFSFSYFVLSHDLRWIRRRKKERKREKERETYFSLLWSQICFWKNNNYRSVFIIKSIYTYSAFFNIVHLSSNSSKERKQEWIKENHITVLASSVSLFQSSGFFRKIYIKENTATMRFFCVNEHVCVMLRNYTKIKF